MSVLATRSRIVAWPSARNTVALSSRAVGSADITKREISVDRGATASECSDSVNLQTVRSCEALDSPRRLDNRNPDTRNRAVATELHKRRGETGTFFGENDTSRGGSRAMLAKRKTRVAGVASARDVPRCPLVSPPRRLLRDELPRHEQHAKQRR